MFKKKAWIIVLVLVMLAAGGGYYYYTTLQSAQAQVSAEEEIKTTRVRRGDIMLAATGAGTVISSVEVDLSFDTNGTVTQVNVAAGDKVAVGDVLASIDDITARKALVSAQSQVEQAMQNLITAQDNYDDLVAEPTDTELLSAEATLRSAEEKLADLQEDASEAEVAKAQANVASAQEALDELINGPDADTLERAQQAIDKAKNSLWSAQMARDAKGDQRSIDSGAYDAAQVSVWNAEISVRQAEMDLAELQEPATEVELQNARANLASARETLSNLTEGPTAAELASAQADLAKAQESLDDLQGGASDNDVTVAKSKITQAELSLEQARVSLEEAEADVEATDLVAPIDATVMTVSIETGERVTENATVISLADLATPQIEVYVDESDMAMIKVGYPATVEFDALPDEVFNGHVVSVDPQLKTVGGTYVVRGIVELDADSFAKPESLMPGMNAVLDIIGGQAQDAVLVPVEALRDLGDGQYAVFVMENDEPRMRIVEVGLMDYTYAEILSGLDGGETISTGIVETN